MDCDITLYRREVKERHLKVNSDLFFSNYNNLLKFSSTRKSSFKNKLFENGFELNKAVKGLLFFIHPKHKGVTVLLTSNYIYFTSPLSFEKWLTKIAVSFTKDGYLARFNRKNSTWL